MQFEISDHYGLQLVSSPDMSLDDLAAVSEVRYSSQDPTQGSSNMNARAGNLVVVVGESAADSGTFNTQLRVIPSEPSSPIGENMELDPKPIDRALPAISQHANAGDIKPISSIVHDGRYNGNFIEPEDSGSVTDDAVFSTTTIALFVSMGIIVLLLVCAVAASCWICLHKQRAAVGRVALFTHANPLTNFYGRRSDEEMEGPSRLLAWIRPDSSKTEPQRAIAEIEIAQQGK